MRKERKVPWVIALIAALLIVFSVQTDTGMALMKNIKALFVPEKEVIYSIEGQDETIDVHLNEGKNSNYIIYIDEENYTMTKGDQSDMITPIYPVPDKYPAVSMEIKNIPTQKPEDYVKELEIDLKKDFPELRAIEEVTEPVEGYLLHGAAGHEATSRIVHAYVVSDGKEGSYLILENYFLEAAEGHGARFHRMLESFEVVD